VTQLWSHSIGKRGVAVLLSAQGVGFDIGLAGLVVDSEVIIFNQLQPSLLPQVQFRLSEDVLEAFVVTVYFTSMTDEIVPPYLKSVHYCHTRFCKQNQVLITYVSMIIYSTHMDIKCS
jgi:hypothetical protein